MYDMPDIINTHEMRNEIDSSNTVLAYYKHNTAFNLHKLRAPIKLTIQTNTPLDRGSMKMNLICDLSYEFLTGYLTSQ